MSNWKLACVYEATVWSLRADEACDDFEDVVERAARTPDGLADPAIEGTHPLYTTGHHLHEEAERRGLRLVDQFMGQPHDWPFRSWVEFCSAAGHACELRRSRLVRDATEPPGGALPAPSTPVHAPGDPLAGANARAGSDRDISLVLPDSVQEWGGFPRRDIDWCDGRAPPKVEGRPD